MAFAADVDMPTSLPAVSGLNGKLQGSVGWIDFNNISSDTVFRGGASLSVPVGDMFGLQADLAVVDAYSDTAVSGTLHAFTRDPNSYLLGVIGGFGNVGSTDVFYTGPEVELYLDSVSLEATAGYMNVDFGSTSKDKVFAIADVALYATDNLRLSVGGRSIAGFESANAGLEWFLGDVGLPASFTVNGSVGEHGYTEVSAGFNLYFGGDSSKSLIRRHREDDPRNRSLDIFSDAGAGAINGVFNSAAPPPPPPPPT